MQEERKEYYLNKLIENLPVLRAKLQLSQQELANVLGVSRQQIVAIENGKRNMSWNIFLSLLLIFSRNKETKEMLRFFDVWNDELISFIEGNKNSRGLI